MKFYDPVDRLGEACGNMIFGLGWALLVASAVVSPVGLTSIKLRWGAGGLIPAGLWLLSHARNKRQTSPPRIDQASGRLFARYGDQVGWLVASFGAGLLAVDGFVRPRNGFSIGTHFLLLFCAVGGPIVAREAARVRGRLENGRRENGKNDA